MKPWRSRILVGSKTNLLPDMEERYDAIQDGENRKYFDKKTGEHFATMVKQDRFMEIWHDGTLNEYGWRKMPSAESGILVGKSDIAGREGMPALMPDGRILKVGGGEIIMSERASTDNCHTLSKMNVEGGGVAFDCDLQKVANTDRASGKMPKDEWHQENASEGTQIPPRYKEMGFTHVGHMIESTQPEKKWMVLAKKGDQYKVIHGGQKGMEDFSQHKDEARRQRFWKRMGGEDSEYTRDPFSPLYWHKKYGTWAGGGQNAATGIQINKNPTKNELRDVLSGIGEYSDGSVIQTTASHLRRNRSTGEISGRDGESKEILASDEGRKIHGFDKTIERSREYTLLIIRISKATTEAELIEIESQMNADHQVGKITDADKTWLAYQIKLKLQSCGCQHSAAATGIQINKKPTRDEIYNVITGTRPVDFGESIHAAIRYLKGNEATSKVAPRTKREEEEILRKYKPLISISPYPEVGCGGTEHLVYRFDGKHLIKCNSSYFYNSWEDYFNNLLLHNYIFPATAYELIGFTEIDGKFRSVAKQRFIKATEPNDMDFVKEWLTNNGFKNTRNDDYLHSELGIIIEDLHDQNIITENGIIYFIDTVFYLKSTSTTTAEAGTKTTNMKNIKNLYDRVRKWSGLFSNEEIQSVIDGYERHGGNLIVDAKLKRHANWSMESESIAAWDKVDFLIGEIQDGELNLNPSQIKDVLWGLIMVINKEDISSASSGKEPLNQHIPLETIDVTGKSVGEVRRLLFDQPKYNDDQVVIVHGVAADYESSLRGVRQDLYKVEDQGAPARIKTIDIINDVRAYASGTKTQTPMNYYYLKIGNKIQEHHNNVVSYTYEIRSFKKNTDGNYVAMVKEHSITPGRPTPEFEIKLDDIMSHIENKHYTIEGCTFETDRDKVLLQTEIASIINEEQGKELAAMLQDTKLRAAQAEENLGSTRAEHEAHKAATDDTIAGMEAMASSGTRGNGMPKPLSFDEWIEEQKEGGEHNLPSVQYKNYLKLFETEHSIPNNYKNKSIAQVWNEWTPDQKMHFLSDHINKFREHLPISKWKNQEWSHLPSPIQKAVKEHIEEGSYAKGIKTKANTNCRGEIINRAKEIEKKLKSKGVITQSRDEAGFTLESIYKGKPVEGEYYDEKRLPDNIIKLIDEYNGVYDEYLEEYSASKGAKVKPITKMEKKLAKDLEMYDKKHSKDRGVPTYGHYEDKPSDSSGTRIKKLSKKGNKWVALIPAPKAPTITTKCPEWAKTIATHIHPGTKLIMVKGGDEFYVRKVVMPAKGLSNKEADKIAKTIVNKIHKHTV